MLLLDFSQLRERNLTRFADVVEHTKEVHSLIYFLCRIIASLKKGLSVNLVDDLDYAMRCKTIIRDKGVYSNGNSS
jgi:hypothetical protein